MLRFEVCIVMHMVPEDSVVSCVAITGRSASIDIQVRFNHILILKGSRNKVFFSGPAIIYPPPSSSLVATFFWYFFRASKKRYFFLVARPLPPLVAGPQKNITF